MTSAGDSKPVVRLIHHMARSGGTLMSRCLGSMRHVLLLSEIHPLGVNLYSPKHNPVAQAQRWFSLFEERDIALLQRKPSMDFVAVIELILRRSREHDRVLVIRDWTHLDFTGVPFYPVPSYRLTLAEVLGRRFDLIQTTTVRHPIDQWLSLSNMAVMQNRLSLDNFLHGYRKFAEHCARIGFIRYEDFVQSPEDKMRDLCERLKISYDGKFLERWPSYNKVTGDVVDPVSLSHTEIKKFPRKPIDSRLVEQFARNSDYQESLVLLGYAHPG